MFSFSKSDKVLVIAPHPDDESLGAGGLLQRLFAEGIPVRILFATNGENNAWAQRYWEKRWMIGPVERVRWGRRRREEALNAISVLGGKADCAKFLNLPDQGITDLLMQGDPDLSLLIAEEIKNWEPTLAVIPTIQDAHPDHSALSVACSMALNSAGRSMIQAWKYLVHKPKVQITQDPLTLLLSPEEVERKRRAILCHETQVTLSRGRFTRFAKIAEAYFPDNLIESITCETPLAAASLHAGVLSLQFKVSQGERLHSKILLILTSRVASAHRLMLQLPIGSGPAQIWDTTGGRRLEDAIVQWSSSGLFVDITVYDPPDLGTIYAKLSGWSLFFDRSGWSQVTVPARREENLVRRAKVPGLMTP
jgi:LmbE family N-acetylglucosaminyl deacetylase